MVRLTLAGLVVHEEAERFAGFLQQFGEDGGVVKGLFVGLDQRTHLLFMSTALELIYYNKAAA